MKADEAQRAKISSLEAQVHRGDENLYEDKSKVGRLAPRLFHSQLLPPFQIN
jgi:hypothetical protein